MLIWILAYVRSALVSKSVALKDLARPYFLAKAYETQLQALFTLQEGPAGIFLIGSSHSQSAYISSIRDSTCEFIKENVLFFEEAVPGRTINVSLPEEVDQFVHFYIIDCQFRKEWGPRVSIELKVPADHYFSEDTPGPWLWLAASLSILPLCIKVPSGSLSEGKIVAKNSLVYLIALLLRLLAYFVTERLQQEVILLQICIRVLQAWVRTVYCYTLLSYAMGWRIREGQTTVQINTVAIGLLLLTVTLCYEMVDCLTQDEAGFYHRFDSHHGLTHLLLNTLLICCIVGAALHSSCQSHNPHSKLFAQLAVFGLVGLAIGGVAIILSMVMVEEESQELVVESLVVLQMAWWALSFRLIYREGSFFNKYAKAIGYNQLGQDYAV